MSSLVPFTKHVKNSILFTALVTSTVFLAFCQSAPVPSAPKPPVANTAPAAPPGYADTDPRKKMQEALVLLLFKENPKSEKHFQEHGFSQAGDPCAWRGLKCNEQKEGIQLLLDRMEIEKVSKKVLDAFPKLQVLSLEGNQLQFDEDLDVSNLSELVKLFLSSNFFTTSPNLSKNPKLEEVSLALNQLTTPPDVSNNLELKILHLFNNQLTTHPDISNNLKLESLLLGNNKFSPKSISALKLLKKKRPSLKLSY